MYAKIFSQIFDSSIAEHPTVRHLFMDLIVLADASGVVDMTHEAIAKRTGTRLDIVRRGIAALCSPDPRSRSQIEDGRRMVLINSHRDWGWKLVNHGHYRSIRVDGDRTAYFRDYDERRGRCKPSVINETPQTPQPLHTSTHVSTQAEAEAEAVILHEPKNGSRRKAPISTEEIITEIQQQPAFVGLDVNREYARCAAWCRANNKPEPSKRRLVNWCLRAASDAPLLSAVNVNGPYLPVGSDND